MPKGFVPHSALLAPAKALHEIDQIIGNEETIDAEDLGKIRGIVLTSLNEWHNIYGNWGCHEEIEIDPGQMVVEMRGDS
jgi:hypothetical protein